MEEILSENIQELRAQVYALGTLVGLTLAHCMTSDEAKRAVAITKKTAMGAYEELDMQHLAAIDVLLARVQRLLP